jgi:DNA polymerase-1
MKIIDTQTLDDTYNEFSDAEIEWLYNGLDCCLTSELRDKMLPMFDEVRLATYRRAIDMGAPFLDMMLRGTLVDTDRRQLVKAQLQKELAHLESLWDRLIVEGLGMHEKLNWKSPLQVNKLFYVVLGLPEIKARNAQGVMAPSVDREALEKLSAYHTGSVFANFILAMRDKGKAIGFLETPLDKDNRIRCNFNIAGTTTGRRSSSFSDFGTGTNLQNVDRELRYIFVPDPGKVFVNIDLEQGDSRGVGALCWDFFYESHGPEFAGAYLDACESGDLHTVVSRMGWPDMPWPQEQKLWKKMASETIAYRNFTIRDMAKKLGHGTNYLGQPATMAMHTKVPKKQIEDFQTNYFSAFPCVKEWQLETIRRLQRDGHLTHLYGRRRHFFGRLDDNRVHNAAIAYCPQGMTGEAINIGIMNLWLDGNYELLIQVHDSILLQIDQKKIDLLVPRAIELLKAHLHLKGGRDFFIPCEAKVGWNWGDESKENPWGLKKWKGEKTRQPPRRFLNRQRVLKELQ